MLGIFTVAPPLQGFAMDPAVLNTLIVSILGLATIAGPIVTILVVNSGKRKEKEEQYAREDLVAQRVEEAAREAKKSAVDMVAATREASESVKARQVTMSGQLQEIHTLVNSNLTTQYQITLTATKAHLATLEDAIAAKKKTRQAPNAGMLLAVEALRKNVVDQETALAERLKATEEAARAKQALDQKAVPATTDTALVQAADKMAGAADSMERAVDKAEVSITKLTKK